MVKNKNLSMAVYTAMLGTHRQFPYPGLESKPIPNLLPTDADHEIMLKAGAKRARKMALNLARHVK
jgi:hypothetical protein